MALLLAGCVALTGQRAYAEENDLERAHQNRELLGYIHDMDASLREKVTLISPWIRRRPIAGRRHSGKQLSIFDIGSANGTLLATLQRLRGSKQQARLVGIDLSSAMVAAARREHGSTGIKFKEGDARQAHGASADSVIASSILHEVFSYASGNRSVRQALRATHKTLAPGGRFIIRDFVQPGDGRREVILEHHVDDIQPGHSFEDFARTFSQGGSSVPCEVIDRRGDRVKYKTTLTWAYEFIYRKDYHADWQAELSERYGFTTMGGMLQELMRTGFKIVHKKKVNNPWVTENRLQGKVAIRDAATREKLTIPAYQMLIVAEKRPAVRPHRPFRGASRRGKRSRRPGRRNLSSHSRGSIR